MTLVECDFFTEVPRGADAYLLLRVLHDWDDQDAIRILRQIRKAMDPSARILIIDGVVGPPNEDPSTKFLDLMMLVSAGGRERNAAEWQSMLRTTGFRLEGILPAGPGRSIINAVLASD